MSAAAERPADSSYWRIAAWYGLAVMILVSMAGNSISQIMALLTEAMKRDLSMTDAQIGAMRGVATTLVVAIASYPIAWLADRIDRRIVFALCMLIWSAATVAMGFAVNYEMLFLLAIGLAFGESVLGPVTFAMIPDLFPPERRMLANSIFFISQLLGVAAGLTLGGWLINSVGGLVPLLPAAWADAEMWRLALPAAAIPTLVLIPFVLLMRLKRRERPAKGPTAPRDSIWPFMREHARTLMPIFIGFGLLAAANFVPFGWLAVIMMRNLGEAPSAVGFQLGQVFAIGGVLGVVGANVLARVVSKNNPELAPIRIAQIGATVAIIACLLYLVAREPWHFYAIATVQLIASAGALVLSPTLTQNVTVARTRARMIAIGGMFYIGFGALSPLLVGAISDALGAGGRDLLYAMLIVAIPAFALGAIALQFSTITLSKTLAAVRDDP
jgi:MFS family permease